MIENEEREYSEDINKILKKKYPFLSLSTNLAYDDNEELKQSEIYDSQNIYI